MKTQRGCRGRVPLLFNLGARWGEWSAPRPGRFNPGKEPVPIIHTQRAGCAQEPACTGTENLDPPGFDPRTVQPVASRSADYANIAIPIVFEIMETMNITLNSKKPSNYITVLYVQAVYNCVFGI
jgi:hypothetical protein